MISDTGTELFEREQRSNMEPTCLTISAPAHGTRAEDGSRGGVWVRERLLCALLEEEDTVFRLDCACWDVEVEEALQDGDWRRLGRCFVRRE